MNTNKPHKGIIIGRKIQYPQDEVKQYGPNLGFLIVGQWQGHPQFGFQQGHTSLIVKENLVTEHDYDQEDTVYEVETLNSRYTVVIPKELE